MPVAARKDLYVMTADLDMETTMKRLLTRHEDIHIRKIRFDVGRHLDRDPGCRRRAVDYLRPHLNEFDHALVMFDRDGCGDSASRAEIQERVGHDLHINGWRDRSKAIVIEPFLETWVWNQSDDVPRILGWPGDYRRLRLWLRNNDLWPRGDPKPPDPKKAMKAMLKQGKTRHTSTIFEDLAAKASLQGCRDPAFGELLVTLRRWFPTPSAH